MSRLARIALALLAATALAACSSSTMTRLAYANAALAYSNMASAIAWTVDDYVDMTDAQEGWVKERASRAMDWHRAEELPRARKVLESMLAKSGGTFSPQDLAALQAEVRSFYRRAMGQLVPDMAEFLATTDVEQLGRIEKKLAQDNRDFLKESVRGTPEDRRKRWVQRFVSHLEAWTGALDDAQRGIIEAACRDMPDFTHEMLGERRYRQSEVLAMVRARTPRAEMEPRLRRLFVDIEEWRRPEYRDAVHARDAKMQEAVAAISATLTPKQRASVRSRIEGLIRDIDKVTAAS
jgi:hypothetical protein